MVVKYKEIDPKELDLGYLALFVGQRVNELVVQGLLRAGFKHVRESHGYVIQHLIGRDRSISDLARRMGISQQATSKKTAEMVRLGILELKPAQDRRAKTIQISNRGWESIQFARKKRKQIHRRLEKVVCPSVYGQTKAGLIACLEQLGGLERIRSRRAREPE